MSDPTPSRWAPFGPTVPDPPVFAPAPSTAPAPPPSRIPARRVAVVTCMDVRIDPLAVLGLRLGDAHVIRNAGAMVSDDVIRSLRLSTSRREPRR